MVKTNATQMKNCGFQATVLGGLFCLAYWVPLRSIVNVWLTNDDYFYGFFIPVISAYLIWEKRHDLRNVPIKSSWRMLPVFVIVMAVSLFAVLGSSGNISRPLTPVLLILGTSFCFGVKLVKYLFVPLAFLLFMVPMPAILERTLGLFLKRMATELGGGIIQIFNIPVYVSGNVIDLGVTKLQVVDACSGMRYVIPLMAFGALYGYLFERVLWKRIACFIATLPTAVLTNALRIGITGILTSIIGPEFAEGFAHDFFGWAIFVASCGIIFLFGKLLRHFPPQNSPATQTDSLQGTGGQATAKAFLVSCIMLSVVAGLTLRTHALPPVKLRSGINMFPLYLDGWQGRSEPMDSDIITASGAEQAFGAQYLDDFGREVGLYLGYRGTAFLENENFLHSPTVCLPSSGWKTVRTSVRSVVNVPRWGTVPVTEMIVENMGQTLLVYFWFQTKDKVTHDKNFNRFQLSQYALMRDNTYDLFIREIVPMRPNESIPLARERLDRFTRTMSKSLMDFMQKEVLVER